MGSSKKLGQWGWLRKHLEEGGKSQPWLSLDWNDYLKDGVEKDSEAVLSQYAVTGKRGLSWIWTGAVVI